MLGLDNLLFGAEAISLGLAWPIVSVAAFLLAGTAVFLLQAGLQKDRWWLAALKALICGLLAAVPTSLGGTILATLVLAWAGVSRLTQRTQTP